MLVSGSAKITKRKSASKFCWEACTSRLRARMQLPSRNTPVSIINTVEKNDHYALIIIHNFASQLPSLSVYRYTPIWTVMPNPNGETKSYSHNSTEDFARYEAATKAEIKRFASLLDRAATNHHNPMNSQAKYPPEKRRVRPFRDRHQPYVQWAEAPWPRAYGGTPDTLEDFKVGLHLLKVTLIDLIRRDTRLQFHQRYWNALVSEIFRQTRRIVNENEKTTIADTQELNATLGHDKLNWPVDDRGRPWSRSRLYKVLIS